MSEKSPRKLVCHCSSGYQHARLYVNNTSIGLRYFTWYPGLSEKDDNGEWQKKESYFEEETTAAQEIWSTLTHFRMTHPLAGKSFDDIEEIEAPKRQEQEAPKQKEPAQAVA